MSTTKMKRRKNVRRLLRAICSYRAVTYS